MSKILFNSKIISFLFKGVSSNSTVSTCTSCKENSVHLECPVNTSHWEKDNNTVCEESSCTLQRVSESDIGYYQCAQYGIVLAVGTCVNLHQKLKWYTCTL